MPSRSFGSTRGEISMIGFSLSALFLLASNFQDPAPAPFECLGTVHPAHGAALAAREGLILVERSALGEAVEAGQIVATFADAEEALAVQRAELELRMAHSELRIREITYRRRSEALEIARRHYDSQKLLHDNGRLSGDEVIAAEMRVHDQETAVLELEAKIEEAKLRVSCLEMELEIARVVLQSMRLVAPFAGVVVAVGLEPGERSGEEPVIEILDTSRLRLRCEVPLASLAAVKKGGSARVFADPGEKGKQGASFEGRLLVIEPRLDPKTGTGVVWLDLGEVSSVVMPGQSCRAVFAPR